MMVQQPRQQLGMISVPWQEYTTPYAPAEALMYGTVFSGLNQPYTPISMQQSAPGRTKYADAANAADAVYTEKTFIKLLIKECLA